MKDTQGDRLEALLSSVEPIEDDGFTERVVAALPPPRRPMAGATQILAWTAIGIGLLVAWSLGPWMSELSVSLTGAFQQALTTGTWVAPVAVTAAVWLLSLSELESEM